MRRVTGLLLILTVAAVLRAIPLAAQNEQSDPVVANGTAVLWTDPGDIKSRNLFYGPGGKQDEPRMPLRFLHEDKGGASPKFDVRDQNGKKWRLKLGDEAQPETVASRLLWAVGYVANEDYFFSELKIDNLTPLNRGQNFVQPGGEVKQARLQRHPGGEKKVGTWSWRHNPFTGTREFNGLRVMMALISNWDLKDENSAIYDDAAGRARKLYEVSDVGASFGMSGKSYTDKLSKNNLGAYRRSKFISKVTPDYVDFNFPTHPPIFYVFNFPLFFGHLRMHWVGKHIPRADAKWIGSLLAQLSPEQIRDAFRAAGYRPQQVEAYADAVQARIAELQSLEGCPATQRVSKLSSVLNCRP